MKNMILAWFGTLVVMLASNLIAGEQLGFAGIFELYLLFSIAIKVRVYD